MRHRWHLTNGNIASWLVASWLAGAMAPAAAAQADMPQAGHDYYSWQIASGNPKDLQKLFAQYRTLPYLRIERRGTQHVLRAGFWASATAARNALTTTAPTQPLIRTASYRPEAVLHQNWSDTPSPSAAVTPTDVAPEPPTATITTTTPAPVPTPIAPPKRSAAVSATPPTDATLRAFNQEDYALAFNVFLGNGDSQRAFRIASQAVASVPTDLDWRRKLARLSEWTSQPLIAWEHWNYLFQHGDRSPETTNAVLRLAPLAGQPDAAIAVWKARAMQGDLSPAQWKDLYALFETAGRATEASLFFEAQYRRRANVTLLEYAAQLADNVGDDTRAIGLYQERTNTSPFSLDATAKAVLLLIRKDRLRDAFNLMQAHRHEVPAEAEEFWRTLGNTAWDLQESAAAESAYRTYTQSKQATAGDWSRLIFLARQRSPQLGAELALDAYRRFDRLDDLLLAWSIYAQNADFVGQARVLKALTPQDLERAQANPSFLILRAQYYQHQGEMEQAWGDYRHALTLAPDDSQVTLPALWFLIDRGRSKELAPLLRQLAPLARSDPRYWLAFAAAHQTLDQPREALGWYQKEVRQHPADALLLLNYADTLQTVRRVGMADRVRRHAWVLLREQAAQRGNAVLLDKQPALLAWARLQLLNQPGDASLQLVRDTVTQLRGLDANALQGTQQVQELVLGWAVSSSQFLNARQWMWLTQARKANAGTPPPAWAESQIALQLGDTQDMQKLLDQRASSMPVYNRYDSAYTLGYEAQALQIGFDTLQRNDSDEDMHDRWRQHAPAAASYVQYRASNDSSDTLLSSQNRQIEASLQMAPHTQLLLGWSQTGQSTSENTLATLPPATERLSSIGMQWQYPRGSTYLRGFERNELSTQAGASLEQTWNLGHRLQLTGGLGYRADASESIPLRVAGNRDTLQMGLNYAVDKRTSVRLHTQWARYRTQLGDDLGEGRINDLEGSYRIRTEYPDARVRLYVSDQAYLATGDATTVQANLPIALRTSISAAGIDAVRYFVPESSTTWGGCLDFGENLAGQALQETYTRAARPFMELCTLDQSRSGNGYSAAMGMATSVLGPDHLLLRLEQNEGGVGSIGGSLTRIWTLRYRYYF